MSPKDSKSGINIGHINNYGQANFVQGDLNQVYNSESTSGISVDGLIKVLQQVEAMVAKSALDQQQKAKIQADVRATIIESQTEQPQKGIVLAHIERALALVNSFGGAIAASQSVLPMLKQAYEWAQKLF